jgi:hypothetical protein
MSTTGITEAVVAALFTQGRLRPQEFGLTKVEIRRVGRCEPAPDSPCRHDDEDNACCLVMDVFPADGDYEIGTDCCDQTCPNLIDVPGGFVEGIGGEYRPGQTFSYIGDDKGLQRRVWQRAAELIGAV